MDTDLFINITDLAGSTTIHPNTPIIFIYSEKIHILLRRLSKDTKSSILELNAEKVKAILKDKNINYDNYIQLGHIYIKNNNFSMKRVILAHRNIVEFATDYKYVCNYGSGSLWHPLRDNFKALGLVYSNNKSKPDLRIGLLPAQIVSIGSVSNIIGILNNRYGLITHSNIGIQKIMNDKFYRWTTPFKMMNNNGEYLTRINNRAELKTNIATSKSQTVAYNAQGELTIDGACLTRGNDRVDFNKCTGSPDQIWERVGSKWTDSESCLATTESDISMKACQEDDTDQIWNIVNTDNENTDYRWNTYKGKNVILVESENPWYINKDITHPMKIASRQELTDDRYKAYADYRPTRFIMDTTKPDLGYGHSYASRQGEPCIEGFESGDIDNNKIMLFICIIVLAVLLYNTYIRR